MSRYEDVLHIFKNPKLYSSEGLRLTLVNRALGPSALSAAQPSRTVMAV